MLSSVFADFFLHKFYYSSSKAITLFPAAILEISKAIDEIRPFSPASLFDVQYGPLTLYSTV